MSRARYIGDEVHAAAWRLAGIDTRVVADTAQAAAALDEARQAVDLVLLAPAQRPALTPGDRRALTPLVLALPEPASLAQAADVARRVRKLLGMEP